MIRLAVIGRNFVVDNMIKAMNFVSGIKLCGICSRTAEGAEEFARRYGIGVEGRYVGIDALAAADNIDAVYIATPNIIHEEQAVKLLASGKHVLVEKPAAVSARAYEHMFETAKLNGVILMEGMMPLYMPGFYVIKRLIGKITPIRRACLSYFQYSSRYDKFKNGVIENAFKPELGGGSLMDIGVYCAAMSEGLFGTPQRISAESLFLENGIDGEGTAVMMYSGMMVDISYSKITDSVLQSQICGEEGCIAIDSVSRPHVITLALRDGSTHVYDASHLDTDRYNMRRLDEVALSSIEVGQDGLTPSESVDVLPDMTYELRHFVHLIENDSLQVSAREQMHTSQTLAVLDGIRQCCDIKFC